MSMTDSIADLLTRIRNANRASHEKVDVPFSRIKQEIVRIIKDEGFIKNYRFIEDRRHGTIRVFMKYGPNRERVIKNLERISRPGCRVYTSAEEIPRVLGGLGVAILSTSKGIMTDRQARRAQVGGEVLCYIW
ncbi:30S ribosomal protein S8 [candidate division FCPU426 bacterium]|nr:30S ribosomal protein S8 [candidate division FCPU426 bacterium]